MLGAPNRNPQRRNCHCVAQFLLYGLLVCVPIAVFSAYDCIFGPSARVASRSLGRHRHPTHCSEAQGPINHALFFNGARIIDGLTSPTKPIAISNLYSSSFADYDVSLQVEGSHGPESVPEIVLGLFSHPHALWFFDGSRGYLTVALAGPVRIGTVRLHGHDAERPCLPRHVNIWGLVPPPDSKRVAWNLFDWPAGGLPQHLSRFELTGENSVFARSASATWIPLGHSHNLSRAANHTDILLSVEVRAQKLGVHAVSLEFKENWGASYTCFAGLGIYESGEV